MRQILRRLELVADDWRYAGEEDGAVDVIVPLAEWRANAAQWDAWKGRVGLRISPPDAVETLVDLLPKVATIAIEFPNPGDGRGYSQARLLRERYKYHGELRAVGHVKQDQAVFMTRCGFDVLELAAGVDAQAVLETLRRFTVAYQPAEELGSIRKLRYHTAAG